MPRRPVAATTEQPDLLGHGGGSVVVVCDDGTVWVGSSVISEPLKLTWVQLEPPVPGSPAAG